MAINRIRYLGLLYLAVATLTALAPAQAKPAQPPISADRLPDSDPDSIAFHRVLRARVGIATAAQNVAEAVRTEREQRDLEDRQIKLL